MKTAIPSSTVHDVFLRIFCACVGVLLLLPVGVQAKKPIRDEFFAIYSSAQGSVLEVDSEFPSISKAQHCGVCHYSFENGGDPWNPYGWSIKTNMDAPNNMSAHDAILAVAGFDQDGDGFSSQVEILDTTNFSNTPTFPGYSSTNYTLADVADGELLPYITPSTGGDTEPPHVTILQPNGGEVWTANQVTNIIWVVEDHDDLAGVSLYLSLDNGATYDVIKEGISGGGETNSYAWFPPNRPSATALIRIDAVDTHSNSTNVESAAVFSIVSPPGGVVPTTLRDFDMPGSQPHELDSNLLAPENCAACHGGYSTNHEPYFAWQGSMMAHASTDPLFLANMAIANQDAPDSGDLCLRCHIYAGWVQGRSVPTSGEAMLDSDKFGVSCALCHRMIDPVYEEGVSPAVDLDIINNMLNPGTNFGNGMVHLDPSDTRRGPFTDASAAHATLVSPFHREAALCGTCHDVSNPAFDRNPDGSYSPNTLDAPADEVASSVSAPVERTYSEWLFSDFNSPSGVYLPEFAGNKTNGMVATCQDCHLRDIAGYGCDTNLFPGVPLREDLPLHDMTGGSTWLPIVMVNNGMIDSNALPAVEAGVQRATYLLQNAADMVVGDGIGAMLTNVVVTVTNNSGHKLPTGYPEGRRIWVNVQFFDASTNLLSESAAYDLETGVLEHDAEAKIYEIHPGMDSNLVWTLGTLGQTNFTEGPSFHFVLNNAVYEDNRIPPRGFVNANFETFGGAPVGHAYADGQYWDETSYVLPEGTRWAEVRLYYQSTSKEFVEFLYTNNVSNGAGELMYDLWRTNGMCPPTLMQEAVWRHPFQLAGARYTNNVFRVDFHCRTNSSYTIQYTDSLQTPVTWSDFENNGVHVPTGNASFFEDDFTSNTSGAAPATGMRFYRFQYTDL